MFFLMNILFLSFFDLIFFLKSHAMRMYKDFMLEINFFNNVDLYIILVWLTSIYSYEFNLKSSHQIFGILCHMNQFFKKEKLSLYMKILKILITWVNTRKISNKIILFTVSWNIRISKYHEIYKHMLMI